MVDASALACLSGDSAHLRALHPMTAGCNPTPGDAAAQAFAAILDCDFATAHDLACRAPGELGTDAVGRLAAEMSGVRTSLPSLSQLARRIEGLEPSQLALHCWAACVVAEAAMAAGRLPLAETLAGRVWASIDPADPRTVFAGQTLTRAVLFQGRLDDAVRIAQAVEARARAADLPALTLVVEGILAYVFALRDEPVALGERISAVETLFPETVRSYFTGGALVLAAFALAADGQTGRAAAMMLRAGGGPELDQLQNVDRVYGYELLVAAALGEADTSAAREWADRAAHVPVGEDGMAAAALRRTSARLAAAEGDAMLAAALADEAAVIAAGQTGHLDATRAQLIAGSALLLDIATSPAAGRTLQTAGGRAGEMGAVALAVLARRDLRSIGLRLTGTPQLPMTRREREVADLVIAGLTDARIGRVLGISERTVQLHVARVLRALGVQSRAGVVTALGDHTDPSARTVRSADGAAPASLQRELLTPRQQQVADLIARGYPNNGVAAALQVSVKTIEKHVSDIYRRLGVNSRTALAAAWLEL